MDQVDYRLAQTPEEKKKSTSLDTAPIFAKELSRNLQSSASPISMTTSPNSWTFGVYLFGELYSSVRISVLTSEWRESCSAEAFGEILHPRLDRGEVIIDPARFVADPDKVKRLPELPYLTLRLAYMACEYFNADLGLAIVRAEHQAFYRRDASCTRPSPQAPHVPGPAQAGRADGGGFSGDEGKGPLSAIR